jgi:hypothetical protein
MQGRLVLVTLKRTARSLFVCAQRTCNLHSVTAHTVLPVRATVRFDGATSVSAQVWEGIGCPGKWDYEEVGLLRAALASRPPALI